MHDHDFIEFPELRNNQLEEHQFSSPHAQITADFEADVVKVHDGDTITLTTNFRDFEFPLRLIGLDAPEMNEGGETARDWLKAKLLHKRILVMVDPQNRVDKWGRLLGIVFYLGMDVGQEEIHLGLAVPFEQRKEGELPILSKMFSLKQWF